VRFGAAAPVVSAATLPGIAAAVGVDPAGLVETVARFNKHARAGKDPDFQRGDTAYDREWGDPRQTPNPSLGTVEAGPFHASPISPGALATKGGLRVNGSAEVLSAATGRPIPGLYAAGICSSSVYPSAYPGLGATLGAGMTFGYLAARRVVSALVAQ
jgi:3-oxosteroid 1-dehydrogenase